MEVGYKNLILIDNSMSVGDANFMLCRETAKYICENGGTQDTFRLATFGEDIEYLTDYTSDNVLLTDSIDDLQLTDRDTFITDNLVKILREWKEQDVACRNIILFTDGEESESVLHADEELYYLLRDSEYPVYVVQSIEKIGIPATKNLSAIATISGGRLLLTEFEGSDASSEITLGSAILSAIDISREAKEEEIHAAEITDSKEEIHEEAEAAEEADEPVSSAESLMIYGDKGMGTDMHSETVPVNTPETHASVNTPIIKHTTEQHSGISLGVIFPILGFVFALAFAIIIRLITSRNNEDSLGNSRLKETIEEELKREAMIALDAEEYDCMTVKLNDPGTNTRLLSQNAGSHDIVLEDCNDPTRLFRASSDSALIVGRSAGLCDVAIDYDDSISGRHCELSVKDGSWYVRDLNSSNGTRVNGQKVFQELMLKCGDILMLGQSSLQVRI
ncbi:MAG: FHA domain-containing protein [Lachnospiraceae bacterium]|nr:FHA domain-containing protein [Lachnospiraceae bacterium]